MKDTQGLKRCSIRPNYIEIQLPSGDYSIYRVWTNKRGKVTTTCVVKRVGRADVREVLHDLIEDAHKHFEKRLYDVYGINGTEAYKKYEIIPRSVLDAIHKIDSLPDVKNAYKVNNKISVYYWRKLTDWYSSGYKPEKMAYRELYLIYEDVIKWYDEVSREKADFSDSDSEEYNKRSEEYNSRFFTLQKICAIIGNIQLDERMIGYYIS